MRRNKLASMAAVALAVTAFAACGDDDDDDDVVDVDITEDVETDDAGTTPLITTADS